MRASCRTSNGYLGGDHSGFDDSRISGTAQKKRNPLTSTQGVIREMAYIYRRMKSGRLDHEKGRSLVWSLAQLARVLEAQHLEAMTAKLDELSQLAEQRYGQPSGRELIRLPN